MGSGCEMRRELGYDRCCGFMACDVQKSHGVTKFRTSRFFVMEHYAAFQETISLSYLEDG
jgi:hypothetical protein